MIDAELAYAGAADRTRGIEYAKAIAMLYDAGAVVSARACCQDVVVLGVLSVLSVLSRFLHRSFQGR